jgi:hypothetical protein
MAWQRGTRYGTVLVARNIAPRKLRVMHRNLAYCCLTINLAIGCKKATTGVGARSIWTLTFVFGAYQLLTIYEAISR